MHLLTGSSARESLIQRIGTPLLLLLLAASWTTPIPTLLLYPDGLDVVLVHDEIVALVNDARAAQAMEPLLWDEALQGLAERRVWEIVRGDAALEEIDDSLADELGEPVAELRACLLGSSSAARWRIGLRDISNTWAAWVSYSRFTKSSRVCA